MYSGPPILRVKFGSLTLDIGRKSRPVEVQLILERTFPSRLLPVDIV